MAVDVVKVLVKVVDLVTVLAALSLQVKDNRQGGWNRLVCRESMRSLRSDSQHQWRDWYLKNLAEMMLHLDRCNPVANIKAWAGQMA